jgi:bifunctional non-homologous end joining protein LigD
MAQSKATTAQKTSAKKSTTAGKSTAKNTGSPVEISETEQTLLVDGINVQLTNLQKVYWPKEGFRKGDVVNYYLKMAPFILPYLLERPQSLNRHPNGISGPHFFQKNMKGKLPGWIETFKEFSESTGEHVDYLVCSNEATLIYMANLGCIEINPWHARKQHYLKPDWCLIDLDPDKGNSFDQVVEVANTVQKVLENLGVVSCPKTSGSTGMHIYIPLGAAYDFEQSKTLAEMVVTIVHQELPKLTSMERTPAKRKGKIYLDFLQNKETQTAAAPYSLRPKPGVPVSTPLHWSEVKKGLTPTTWNAFNIFDRVKTEGDLFAPVLGKGIDLESIVQTLQSLI